MLFVLLFVVFSFYLSFMMYSQLERMRKEVRQPPQEPQLLPGQPTMCGRVDSPRLAASTRPGPTAHVRAATPLRASVCRPAHCGPHAWTMVLGQVARYVRSPLLHAFDACVTSCE
jgi:hypothetical protein